MKINRCVLTGQNHYMKERRVVVVCGSDTETVTSLTYPQKRRATLNYTTAISIVKLVR